MYRKSVFIILCVFVCSNREAVLSAAGVRGSLRHPPAGPRPRLRQSPGPGAAQRDQRVSLPFPRVFPLGIAGVQPSGLQTASDSVAVETVRCTFFSYRIIIMHTFSSYNKNK